MCTVISIEDESIFHFRFSSNELSTGIFFQRLFTTLVRELSLLFSNVSLLPSACLLGGDPTGVLSCLVVRLEPCRGIAADEGECLLLQMKDPNWRDEVFLGRFLSIGMGVFL